MLFRSPVYCSVVESFFDRSVEGKDVFANCDYDLMKEYLEHFLLGWHRSPHNTSGMFVCPVWMWKVFWKLLRGAVLLLYLAEGEFLFTSPEWRSVVAGKRPLGRAERGPTRWPLVVVHFPRSMDRRTRGGGERVQEGATANDKAGHFSGLPRLRGEPDSDAALLRSLSPTPLRAMLGWWAQRGLRVDVLQRVHVHRVRKDDFLSSAEQSARRMELVELGRQVLAEACRAGTSEAAKRGLKALTEYREVM